MVLGIKRVWSNKNTLKIINECNCTLKGEQVSLSFFFKICPDVEVDIISTKKMLFIKNTL